MTKKNNSVAYNLTEQLEHSPTNKRCFDISHVPLKNRISHSLYYAGHGLHEDVNYELDVEKKIITTLGRYAFDKNDGRQLIFKVDYK